MVQSLLVEFPSAGRHQLHVRQLVPWLVQSQPVATRGMRPRCLKTGMVEVQSDKMKLVSRELGKAAGENRVTFRESEPAL